MQNYLILGQYNFICDRCGCKNKSDNGKITWEGWMVCHDTCWEPKHPQLFVRGVPDNIAPPWVRPETPDKYVTTINSVPNLCNLPCKGGDNT